VARQTPMNRGLFDDVDLGTATHDQIMIWLDRTHVPGALLLKMNATIENGSINEVLDLLQEHQREHRMNDIDRKKALSNFPGFKWSIESAVWEYPIMNGKYLIGFADLFVTFSRFHSANPRSSGNVDWETVKRPIVFEVKSEIRSVGEVIRQVRLYEQYLKAEYCVVSPDDTFAEVLRGQKIKFIKYEPNAD